MLPVRSTVLVLSILSFACFPTAHAEDGLLYGPTFREGVPSDVLIEGDPALARGHIDAFVDLLESAFELALPAHQEQDLRDVLEANFESGTVDARRRWLALVKDLPSMRDAVRGGNRREGRAGLRAFRTALDQRIARYPIQTASQIVKKALERRHQVVWPGSPPVKGGAVDAYLELAVFTSSLGRNEAVKPTVGQRKALIEELRKAFHGASEDKRKELDRMNRTWLRVKAAWDKADEKTQFALRMACVRFVATSLPPDKKVKVGSAEGLTGYAREAKRVCEPQNAFDAFSNVARRPAEMLKVIREALKLNGKEPSFTFMYR